MKKELEISLQNRHLIINLQEHIKKLKVDNKSNEILLSLTLDDKKKLKGEVDSMK